MLKTLSLLLILSLNCSEIPTVKYSGTHTHTETTTTIITDKDSPDSKVKKEEVQKNCIESMPIKIKLALITTVSSILSALLTGLLVNNAKC